jgi:hypothetical protein
MAKRKHTTKKRHHRRRKMSGINAGELVTNIAGVAVGAAAAGFITSKVLGSQSDTIKAVAAIGLGVATPIFMKSPIGKAAGSGMIAVGVINLLKKSGFVSGLGDDGVEVTLGDIPVVSGVDVMAGMDDMPVVSGVDVMAGDDYPGYDN